jgi:hypothetical protein
MAITIIPLSLDGSDLRVVVNTDVDETEDDDLFDGPVTLYSIDADNSANGAATYIKLYDALSDSATDLIVGTTAPHMILLVPASSRRVFEFPAGVGFASWCGIAGVTAGGTAGTTGPTSAVTVRLVGA